MHHRDVDEGLDERMQMAGSTGIVLQDGLSGTREPLGDFAPVTSKRPFLFFLQRGAWPFLSAQIRVMMSYEDRRREAARTGMAKLRAARKKEMDVLTSQEQSLQVALAYLKAHSEEQHQGITPFAYARRVLRQRHNNAMRKQVESRHRLIQSLCGWRMPQQLYANYVEVPVPNDPGSRRSGFDWLTKKAYNLSLEAERYSSKQTQVDDDTHVKVHLGQDGSCIQRPSLQIARSHKTVLYAMLLSNRSARCKMR
ncbi:hypothetical protein AC1031_016782 [Aphanomyces cochlioides]|nr:hypothetical protein AC1031_016782 [Aphanomyces cochlioides]